MFYSSSPSAFARCAYWALVAALLLAPTSAFAQLQAAPVVVSPPPPPAPPPPAPKPAPEPVTPPADQLAEALSQHNLDKVKKLLAADPALAKTPGSNGAPPLVSAFQNYWNGGNDDQQILETLFADGADVNAADRGGQTPLQAYLARGGGNGVDTLSLLLNKGADIKARDADGKDALLLAVSRGDPAPVSLLLAKGANVNSRDLAGNTPLHLAISSQNQDMVDALLNAGANINLRNTKGEMPIHIAMHQTALQAAGADPSRFGQQYRRRQDKTRGNPLLVPQLLDRGAQINARDQSGVTPLLFALLNRDKINYAVLMQHHAAMDTLTSVMNAAATNDTAALAHLLKTLPDFKDLRAPNGATALHVAALWNAPEAVRLLLRSGLDTTARDAAGETPLHYACWFPEDASMVGLLLDVGANVNAEDGYGETPLHMAVHTKAPDLVKRLLARKASPDLANETGDTPLSLAATRGDVDMATLLVNAGANVNRSSRNYGGTLLSSAIQSRSVPIVRLLVEKGANVNYVPENNGGNSPLMMAAQSGDKEMVQLLVDKGADVNFKTRWGQSVLSSASNYNNNGIAELLKAHGAK